MQIPALPVSPVSNVTQFSHSSAPFILWLKDEWGRDGGQHGHWGRYTIHDQENTTRKLCTLLQTHLLCIYCTDPPGIKESGSEISKQPCVNSLWTLCTSTTWALYITPVQSVCALLFHPLLFSLSTLFVHCLSCSVKQWEIRTHRESHIHDAPRAGSGNFTMLSA